MKNFNFLFIINLLVLIFISCTPKVVVTESNDKGEQEKLVPKKVADEISRVFESPHPYPSGNNQRGKIVWRDTIIEKGAKFIAPHFSRFELSEGDFLIIRSPDNKRRWKYSANGKLVQESISGNGFWGIHIYGDKLIIEIESNSDNGGYGYKIDKISKGFTTNFDFENDDKEAICGADNSQNAICVQNTEAAAYNNSRAVARLLINGTGACTGWLIGNGGELMTNNHCVETAQDALNTTVEFMAEGNNCNSNCQSSFGCPGTIEANTTTLVQTNIGLDYSLLRLPTNVSGTYGFLRLRQTGPVLNERIYIPQHPAGWGKRIAMVVEGTGGTTTPATITSLTRPSCTGTGNGDVGYAADTRGGSSGSPVIGYNDHLVVALHHCKAQSPLTCPNRAVPINQIIADLGTNLPQGSVDRNWASINLSTNEDLYTAHFPSPNIGYAAGGKGVIIKTVDSGNTWTTINNGIPNSAYIYSIFFTDNNIGYAVGNRGNSFKTTNGGNSWSSFNLTTSNIRNIFFVSSNKGFIVADGELFRTTDGGSNWQNINNLFPSGVSGSDLGSSEIYFRDSNNGFILLQGAILKTSNGGNSWTKINIPALATYDIDFIDSNLGFICGIGTGLLKTTDGGNSWTKINTFPSNTPQTVNFRDSNNGFVAGRNGKMYVTEDGGNSWIEDTSTTGNDIHKIVYLNNIDTHIAFGKAGTIIRR